MRKDAANHGEEERRDWEAINNLKFKRKKAYGEKLKKLWVKALSGLKYGDFSVGNELR